MFEALLEDLRKDLRTEVPELLNNTKNILVTSLLKVNVVIHAYIAYRNRNRKKEVEKVTERKEEVRNAVSLAFPAYA